VVPVTIILVIVFWVSLAGVAWTYAGYPLLLLALARLRPKTGRRGRPGPGRPADSAPPEPAVTVIIAAYNEEKAIRRKLESSLALDYPADKLEVIVASDCSTDRTHDIVRELAPRGVRLVVLPERAGKTAAQNLAAAAASGELLIFTDATTELDHGSVRSLVAAFADPRVGCVGAELEYVSAGGSAVGKGGGLYWRYEKRVKQLEAAVSTLIGVSGCLYAVRASAYRPIEPDLISDFVIAGDVFRRGFVTVYGGAVSSEKTHEETGQEFEMRVRVIIRTINALVRRAPMLNPFRYRFFSFQLFSHKVLRYLVPELLLAVLGSGLYLALAGGPWARIYQAVTVAQLALCLAAAAGWLRQKLGLRLPLVHIPFYFLVVNLAALWALVLYLRGERKVTWTTVR
jgi:cellulose synthase/poly-beta-1,6-N-acetylglucosamine synthase-like glycosyltransferase